MGCAPKPDKERTESIFLNDTPGAPRGAALGGLWAHLGWLLGVLGRLLGGSWTVIGRSWTALGGSGALLDTSLALLGGSWAHAGSPERPGQRSGRPLGDLGRQHGPNLGPKMEPNYMIN